MIRPGRPDDHDAVDAALRAAFPTPAEAALVASPRAAGPIAAGLGLAPLAVLPSEQRRGIGAALVRAGLDACRACGCRFVVVLGDPAYYARFGFRRASDLGVANEYGADAEFMLRELAPGGLPPGGGLARYASAFAALPA